MHTLKIVLNISVSIYHRNIEISLKNILKRNIRAKTIKDSNNQPFSAKQPRASHLTSLNKPLFHKLKNKGIELALKINETNI